MRRPLCFALLFLLAVLLCFTSLPSPDGRWEGRKGEWIVVQGEAAELYQPADGSQEDRTFTLTQIRIVSGLKDSFTGKGSPSDQEKSDLFTDDLVEKKVLCYLGEGEALPRAGSMVRVRGKVSAFRYATNPGEFDYRAYQCIRNCIFSLDDAEILAESETYDRLGQTLFFLRSSTAAFFYQTLGEEDGALACAMVLGEKKGLPGEIKTMYQGAGIAHLLAISGLHISMIGMGLFYLLRRLRLPLGCAAAASFGLLCLYAVMTGMSVSTCRALAMFAAMLTAQLLGRTSDTLTSLTAAAFGILLSCPARIQDSGFWLSFLAVAGAAVLVPVLQETGKKTQEGEKGRLESCRDGIFKGVTASLGITLATLPVLLGSYYQWNPWSVLANLVVIPLMGVLLPLLLILAALGQMAHWSAVFGHAAYGLGLPVRAIFLFYKGICRFITGLPGGCMRTGAPKLWQLALFTAGLALLVWRGKRIRPSARLILAACLTGIFLLRLPGPLQITVLDVGQGECVCIETGEHHFWLLDAGSTSKSRVGQYQIIPFLKYCGAPSLEGIIISHWDEDHISALEELFSWAESENFAVGRLFLPDVALQDEGLENLLKLAHRYEVVVERLEAGERMQDGGVTMECLHPAAARDTADRNDSSVVIRLSQGDFSALFTGDLQKEGEEWLVRTYGAAGLDCDLLDAGHHGAANATGAPLLEAACPQAVTISCGRNNRYGHPAKETLQRLEQNRIPYYITAERGAVTVKVKKDGMHICTFLSP